MNSLNERGSVISLSRVTNCCLSQNKAGPHTVSLTVTIIRERLGYFGLF